MAEYDITIRQGSNIIHMYAGSDLEDALSSLIKIANGLSEHDEPWAVTIEVKSDEDT